MLLAALLLWCRFIDHAQTGELSGDVVRISAYHAPPSMIIEKSNGNFTYRGVDYDIVIELMKRLNLSYQFVQLPDAPGSQGPRLIQQILNNEVDLNTYGFTATPERVAIMDFSIVEEIDNYRFLLRYPERESRLLGIIRPFQPTVWIAFLVTLIVVIIALSCLMFIHQYNNQEVIVENRRFKDHLGNNSVYVVTVIASQGEYVPNKKLPTRLLISIWCLMAVVLVNSYTGNLTSYLSVPKLNPIPNSFAALAASNEYKISVDNSFVLTNQILTATSGPYKVLGDFLRKNPDYMTRGSKDRVTFAVHRNAAHPLTSLVATFVLSNDMKATGKCRVTVSDRLQLSQSYNYIFPKNSSIKAAVDIQLLRFWEHGLLDKMRANYRPVIAKCLIGSTKPRIEPLRLLDLSSTFVFWGMGVSVSLFAFIGENGRFAVF